MSKLFPAVILAGGLATRLRPLTEKMPKSLIEVNGEPFIAHQLRLLEKSGIKQVVICIGYLGDAIKSYIQKGDQFGVSVTYAEEQGKLLGTGGAIKNALPLLEENFFVVYGDSYLPCDYKEVQTSFTQSKKLALMTVFRNQGQWDGSNIQFDGNAIIVYDKVNKTKEMEYIDYGLGIFNKQAFNLIPNNTHYDLAVLYQSMLTSQQLAAYEVKNRFYEIGSFAGIDDLSDYLTHLSTCGESL